jgi:hypothetical protein
MQCLSSRTGPNFSIPEEDEIMKKLKPVDVTLPLTGTLINRKLQSVWSETEMQFGKLT